jgi:hypothetical protein
MRLRWINVFLGIWVLASGFIAGARSSPFGDHIALGIGIFLVAFVAMGYPAARKINAALGAWMVLSPFVFRYLDRPMAVNDIVVGILVTSIALTPTRPERRARAAA